MNKELYRSRSDRRLAGVCGGLAEYFGVSSTVVRVIWAIATFAFGLSIFAYIVAALIIPNEPYDN